MHDRNVLSLVKRFAGFALVSLASLATAPAHAEGNTQSPMLLSLLTPPARGEDTLAILEVRTAPAVANALAAATGKRLRRLPFDTAALAR